MILAPAAICLSTALKRQPCCNVFLFAKSSECNADGLLVMHHGKVVYEYLVNGVPAWQTHGLNSASKVFTGCVAAILADQGNLSWDKPLHDYAPQLKGTGDGITVVSRPHRSDTCCTGVQLPLCLELHQCMLNTLLTVLLLGRLPCSA